MKSKLLFSIILLSLFFSVYDNATAQAPSWQWANGIGVNDDDGGRATVIDAAGNIYATGYFEGTVDFDPGPGIFNLTSGVQNDIFISKFDGSCNFVWAKKMGGSGGDKGCAIALDPAGNVLTTGYFVGTGDFDPGPGTFNLIGAGLFDIFISKLDNSGNFIWAKRMGSSLWDEADDIAIDASGSVYITGDFYETVDFNPGTGTFNLTSNGSDDIFISKLDSSGNFVWAKSIGGIDIDWGLSIALDPSGSGDFYTTGYFSETADFDPGLGIFNLTSVGERDIFISKFNGSGNFVWAKAMGGIDDDAAYRIALDPAGSGDIYTTGLFSETADFDPGLGIFNLTSVGEKDIFISKLNGSGNFVWAKAIGGINDDVSYSIAIDPTGNGHLYTTGYFEETADFDPGVGTFNLTSAGYSDIFIVKLDAAGDFEWVKALGGTDYDNGHYMTLDAFGNLIVTGYFESDSITFDSITITNADTLNTEDIFIAKLSGNNCLPCPITVTQSTSGITLTSATLNWSANTCAVCYNMRYRQVGASKWMTKKMNCSQLSKTLLNLTPNTQYEWQVRTKCSQVPLQLSGWSASVLFTTQ